MEGVATLRMEKLRAKIDDIKQRLTQTQLKAFDSLMSNISRVQFALGKKNKLLAQFENVNKDYVAKSDETAEKIRNEGNQFFKSKNYRQALEKYTESIQFARSLALKGICSANRSAAFYYLGNHEAAILDIDDSLKCDYPDDKLHIILDRKGKCLMELKKNTQAIAAFTEAVKTVERTQEEKSADFWKNVLTTQITKCKEHEEEGNKDTEEEIEYSSLGEVLFERNPHKKYIPKLKGAENEQYCDMSEMIEITAAKVGSHSVKAAQKITNGDFLAMAKPDASVLHPYYFSTHCAHCLKYCERTVPCRSCASVGYCSNECEAAAWVDCHGIECEYMGWLDPLWVGRLGHLAFRLTIVSAQYPTKQLKELVCHENLREGTENFQFVILMLHLLSILQHAHKTGRWTTSKTPDWGNVANVLLRHLMVLQCNAYNVTDMHHVTSFKHAKPVDIGLGIYKQLAMMNHNCDPSVEIGFHGNKAVLMASKNLEPGEEICIDYGVTFVTRPYADRQSMLKSQFMFDCDCLACTKKWPMFEDMERKMPTFRCVTCSGPLNMNKKTKCPRCKQVHNLMSTVETLQKSHESFTAAMKQVTEGDFLPQLPILMEHLGVMQRLLIPPWRDFCSCQATLTQAFRLLPSVVKH